jgi:hypothetical protein
MERQTMTSKTTGRKVSIKSPRRRSNDEIMAAALTLIDPPDDQREACRANVASRISLIQQFAEGLPRRPTPRQVKEQLASYLQTLQATKTRFGRLLWRYRERDKDFLVELNAEIEQIEADHEAYRVPPGSKQPDLIAKAAVQCATELLRPEAYHRLGRDSRPPLTNDGPWHQLSNLFYEVAGGDPGSDQVWTYMREIKSAKKLPRRMRIHHLTI